MLRKSDIQLLKELKGEKSIKELALIMDKSPSRVSQIVSNLEQEKLINKRKEGKRKLVSLNQAKTTETLKKINQQYPHIDIPKILSGKNISIFYYLDRPLTVTEIAEKTGNYRNTINRILKNLKNKGVVQKNSKYYKLNQEFEILNKFAKEYIHHTNRQFISKYTGEHIILWESTNEILFQTKNSIDPDLFKLTGPEKLEKYSIPLITTENKYYFYTEQKENIPPEELICHILKIDLGTRYQSYCLVLMKKQEINYKKLREKAGKYGLTENIEKLIKYINTDGKEKTDKLPDWDEFKDLLSEYRVKT